MEKVYLVTEDGEVRWGVDFDILGVFSTKEKAQAYTDKRVEESGYEGGVLEVTEMTVDSPNSDDYYPSASYYE